MTAKDGSTKSYTRPVTEVILVRNESGVLLAIKDQISCIPRTDLETESEMLALEIRPYPACSIIFRVFYRPPNANESFLADFRSFQDKYSSTGLTNLVVVGDFNFANINWNLRYPTGSDPKTVEFCNVLDDFFLLQKNLHVTPMETSLILCSPMMSCLSITS